MLLKFSIRMLVVWGVFIMPSIGVADAADTNGSAATHLRVGVLEEPPFVFNSNGSYSGMAIDLWEMVGRDLGWTWTYASHDFSTLVDLVSRGELDLIVGPIPRTATLEMQMDFSPTFLNSGLGVAAREKPVRSILDILGHLTDTAFLQLTASLILICLIFGLIIWYAERRRNTDHFGGQMVNGFGSGVWWSMVTMSTVGYGDKAPRTTFGRGIALVWIFLSIVLLAAFTGTIASSMTMGRIGLNVNSVNDLRSLTVGVLRDSEAERWLTRSHLSVASYPTVAAGIEAVRNQKLDVMVADRPTLQWALAQEDHTSTLSIQGNIHPERLAFGMPETSRHRESINRTMLRVLDSRRWLLLRTDYGEDQMLSGRFED